MEIKGLEDKVLTFIVEEDGEDKEITDMYYFEEQQFHNNGDCSGYSNIKIKGIKIAE